MTAAADAAAAAPDAAAEADAAEPLNISAVTAALVESTLRDERIRLRALVGAVTDDIARLANEARWLEQQMRAVVIAAAHVHPLHQPESNDVRACIAAGGIQR
jgi:hypothetical protein